jgi:hypothetical protein
VSTYAEYRSFAEECLGWARTAKSNREREGFIQMAETWFAAALLAEEREGAGTTDLAREEAASSDIAMAMTSLPPEWWKK